MVSLSQVIVVVVAVITIVESNSLRFERRANETDGPITYSCERQTFKKSCTDTQRPTQFVLRWYLMKDKCCSYPYGYCHGDEISKQNVIRTKEACEAICIRGEKPTEPIAVGTKVPEGITAGPAGTTLAGQEPTAKPTEVGPAGTTVINAESTAKPAEVASTGQQPTVAVTKGPVGSTTSLGYQL